MSYTTFTTLALAASFLATPSAASALTSSPKYDLVEEYSGANFFDGFVFQDMPLGTDPTDGFVNYVPYATAVSEQLAGLIYYEADKSTHGYIGVDHKNKAPNGRNSVRLTSNDSFSDGALFIADIWHSPLGLCGTWPAFWLTGK